MAEEPCCFVGDANCAAKLMRADALLGGRYETKGQRPLGQRDMGAFHDGAGTDSELLAALFTLAQAFADALFGVGGKLIEPRGFGVTAMRADNAMRPTRSLK